ncbi:MAG: adenylyl-sulfate kinase [Bacteroidetes bacterium]|nr:adenylyl-sulfate kinase [Bacteroidota bacterium]
MTEKLHIIPHQHKIDRVFRERLNGHKSQTLWFTGLSGSGKSTLANLVEQALADKGIRTYLLDGDNIRTGLNKDLDFSSKGRIENIRRISEVAKLMNDAGLVVLTAFISPFAGDRLQAREILGYAFVEIHVDCPVEVCESRDVKGLYQKARKGLISNFTGIDSPFEIPENPELRVSTHLQNIEVCTNNIIDFIIPRIHTNE